jgi:hypothetical protein
MRSAGTLITGVIVTVLMFSGCAPHKLYRTDTEICVSDMPGAKCKDKALQELKDPARPDAGYLLGFIEFDDQGQVFEREQMDAVVKALNERAARQDLLIVVFVHGWKHSAAPGDGNIATFRQGLERLSELESRVSRQTGAEERQVVGVYLGWRGGSVTLPGVKELTFWDRKNTAHKVGHGGVTEVLSRLELVRKTKDATSDGGGRSRTRLVVIGHSFGGALVYSALSQILMSGFVDTVGPAGASTDVKGFGDLVVLINPAFEATRFAPLSDMANERPSYFSSQLPVIAVLTSEADDATKRAFPIGRWFSTFFEKHRKEARRNGVTGEEEMIDQRRANITAVGHFAPYRTHDLRATDEEAAVTTEPPSAEASVERFFSVSNSWERDAPGSEIEFEGSVLKRTSNSAGRNPYLVVGVSKELIRDHNDLDDPRIASFIRQLILIAGQSADFEERQQIRRRVLGK